MRVPFCGEEEAKRIVAPLIEAVGAEPFDIGGLSQARHLEAMAIVMIQALRNGTPPRSAFNLVPADSSRRCWTRAPCRLAGGPLLQVCDLAGVILGPPHQPRDRLEKCLTETGELIVEIIGPPGDQSEAYNPPERLGEHLLADAADPRVQFGVRARLFPQRDENHRDPGIPDNPECGACRAVG